METVVAGALAGDDVLSLCQTLVQGACPMAFFTGDLVAAERYVRLLLDHSERLGLEFWQAYGRCFNALLVIRRGTAAEGASLLRAGLEALRGIQFGVFYGVFLSELAGALGHAGRPADGIAVVDEALARAERNDERWYLPESLRIKGELVLRQGGADAEAGAEVWFRQSLDWSHRQQTTAWELRTTTSLAKLLHRQGRIDEAQKALAASLGSFAEGFASADLKAAKDLLETIA
jgi:predicted ATPase